MQPSDSSKAIAETENAPILPVRGGDTVKATGHVISDGRTTRLHAVGRGQYERVFRDAGGLSVPIGINPIPDPDHIVTVQGTWTGSGIDDARLVQLVDPVEPPEHLGMRIDTAVVPSERRARGELLAPSVLAAVDLLRREGLLFYGIHRLVDGWVGVACATSAEPATRVLEPLLGRAFTLVAVPWSAADVERATDALDIAARDNLLLFQGNVMTPGGTYLACGLVGMVTPDLAAALAEIERRALHVDAWISRA